MRAAAAFRIWLIAALVCGSFGIGISEFVVMGLLPGIAEDLMPRLFAASPESALALAGGTVSAYALGVVVGMFVAPWLLRRRSERAAVLICALAMLLWTLCTAWSPTIELAILLRFCAALTHAAYVGLAAVLVGRMLGPGRQGSGAALVMGGFAIANLLGVPVLTAIGDGGDWRLVLVLCAGLFAIPVVALSLARPPAPLQPATAGGERTGEPAARLGALVLAVTVLASGCFLAVTYVAPIAEWLQQDAGGLSVAAAMLAFGIGMNLGNFGCGRIADRSADAALLGSGAAGAVGAAALCIPAGGAVSVGAGMLLVGIGLGGVSPAAQVLYVRIAARFPKFAASLASGTVNLGSFAGASLGAGALGWLGIAWVPMTALMLFGIGIALQLGRMLGRGRTAELSAATARARAARRRDPADTPTGSP